VQGDFRCVSVAHELSGFVPPRGGESMNRTTRHQDRRMQKFRDPGSISVPAEWREARASMDNQSLS
jgi:hypothetical protein